MTPTVLLYACPEYDPDRIQRIVGQGLDAMGLRPTGRTLVKPNVVASGEFFPHAFTRPEFTEGVLRALKERASGMTELAVGERCGITVPTRFAYKNANYYEMARRVGDVRMHHFDEVPQVEIPLRHPGRLRDAIYTPEPVARADFFVNCPKFKAHPWTTVTFSLKNYIGIQDDRHRLIDHHHQLDEKVADLQYVVQPQFIAIDAITAGEGRMLTPIPFDMGLVIMGNNQVAVDTVCCHIIGLDPLEVPHIRMVHERGFGPADLSAIHVGGDVSLEAASEKASGFRTGLIRVEDYFKGTNIHAYGGRPPGDRLDYCWGGCPGALEEAIEILRVFDASTDDKMPPIHVIFGDYEGAIDAKPGEKLVLIGDCAQYKGTVGGQQIDERSRYRDRSRMDPRDATYEGTYAKIVRVSSTMLRERNSPVLRLKGCPVSVSEQLLTLVALGGLKNPYLDPKQAIPFTSSYLSWKTRTTLNRLRGQPYNISGFTERGAARPSQSSPPSNGSAK